MIMDEAHPTMLHLYPDGDGYPIHCVRIMRDWSEEHYIFHGHNPWIAIQLSMFGMNLHPTMLHLYPDGDGYPIHCVRIMRDWSEEHYIFHGHNPWIAIQLSMFGMNNSFAIPIVCLPLFTNNVKYH
ncbi:UNVERIFIED_CONTAM: hypothetical protein FKN15_018499 [Acipenser sinensis]